MPELPEVETVRAILAESIVGRRVAQVVAHREDQIRPDRAAFVAGLTGRVLVAARRFGKHLLLDLDDAQTLVVHLRMTGQLRVGDAAEPALPHTHLEFLFDDGGALRWRDVRRFGWLHLTGTNEAMTLPSLAACGPDALAADEATFVARLRGLRRQMKPLLLAQEVICGLGNIYADEVLHRARIHPRQRSDRVSRRQWRGLYAITQEILRAAIALRGTSTDGEYVAPDGFRGDYQRQLAVYGREGQPAPCCGGPVRREVIGSRSAHYCPCCQKLR